MNQGSKEMSGSRPLISVVLPVHNEERWLSGCIQSLLRQTYPNIEIIIVDDASEDESYAVAKRYESERVKLFRLEKIQGEGGARNKGIEIAAGDFIIQTDADSLFPPDFIEKSLSYYHHDHKLAALSIGEIMVHPELKGILADYWMLKRKASFLLRAAGQKEEATGFYMFKREVAERVGPYDEKLPSGVDVDFAIRVKRAGFPYRWAREVYFYHADVVEWRKFFMRLFNASRYNAVMYKKWNAWLKPLDVVGLLIRTVIISLIPLYLILALFNSPWFWVALITFLAEGWAPFFVDRESRLLVALALKEKKYAIIPLLPFVMFVRLRASAYGKMYAVLFLHKLQRSTTFDV